jgi:hypothetical protein
VGALARQITNSWAATPACHHSAPYSVTTPPIARYVTGKGEHAGALARVDGKFDNRARLLPIHRKRSLTSTLRWMTGRG